jgi:alkylated DNA repair protein alkB family protein 4
MPLEDCIEPMCEPIPGLFLFENFINETEEGIIINELDGTNTHDAFKDSVKWKTSNFNGLHEGKRWGVHCNLRDRRVYKEENPLPNFIVNILLPKLRRLKCMKGCIPNEANAINYRKRRGDYLKSHVDDRQLSKEAIINLSIAG